MSVYTLLATVDDWSRVADQVHWETMVVAVRPIETLPGDNKMIRCGHDEEIYFFKKLTSSIKSGVQVISVMVNMLPNLEKDISLSFVKSFRVPCH